MSTSIYNSYVKQFGDNIQLLSQQMKSRMRQLVMEKTITGNAVTFERLGATALEEKTSSRLNTPLGDIAHSRRTAFVRTFHKAEACEAEDLIKVLVDPRSDYAMALNAAANRTFDDIILDAALGTAYSGPDGATSVTLPSGQLIAAGGTALTITKLRDAKTLLLQSNVDLDNDELYLVVNAEGLEDLYQITEFINRDYRFAKNDFEVGTPVQGFVGEFLGFKIYHCERITSMTGTYAGTAIATSARPAIAFTKSALGFAVGQDIKVRVDELPGMSYLPQIYISTTFAATRIHDDRVVDIRFAE